MRGHLLGHQKFSLVWVTEMILEALEEELVTDSSVSIVWLGIHHQKQEVCERNQPV